MAQTLNNFINIAKTLAHRHQRFMRYRMTCSAQFLQTLKTYGSGMKGIAYIVVDTVMYMHLHVANRFMVNELEYASSLLQFTELSASSTVNRFEIHDNHMQYYKSLLYLL